MKDGKRKKTAILKHLKHDIKESKESIKEDKSLAMNLKKKKSK